jgi:hypothetical protein
MNEFQNTVSHDNKQQITDHSSRGWDMTDSAHASNKSRVIRLSGGSMASLQNDKLAGKWEFIRHKLCDYSEQK